MDDIRDREGASAPVDLSIAIVSYNTKELLLDCIRSVFAHTTGITCEVIVVDNHSQDGTVAALRETFPAVTVIANPDNRGFAKAVNQAAAVSRGRYVLLLNSDTIIRDQALTTMVGYMDRHSDVGAVSCKQYTGEGRLCRTCFPFPSVRGHLFHAALFQLVAPRMQAAAAAAQSIDCTLSQDVDWANGACLLVHAALLRQLGGLDEGYFMYFEDIDLCHRIHRAGYRVRHLAEAEIVHLVGRSSGRAMDRLNLEWEFSRIRYIEKHFSPMRRWLIKGWIAAGAGWRLVQTMWRGPAEQRLRQRQNSLATIRRLVWELPSVEPVRVSSSWSQG